MSKQVNFFSEKIDFDLADYLPFETWIAEIFAYESEDYDNINYIFCNNDYILDINQEYLHHDYYTDIISFPMSEKPDPISGDIFISIDMVRENALKNKVTFQNELLRVMAHGVLHFLGYKDKTEKDSSTMREKEDLMISLFDKKN